MPLSAIASSLPGLRETAEEIAVATGAEPDFIRNKIGLHERYRLAPGESGLDLAEAACRALLEKTGLAPQDIGLLVYVTQTPDRRVPGSAPELAHRLGASNSVASFDLSLGCSGYVYGLSLVEAFLAFHGIDNALLVTCDPYSRMMASEDKATNAIFGDAATASWVTRQGAGPTLEAVDFGSDGSNADAIRLEAGGANMPLVSLSGPADGVSAPSRDDASLHMDGRGVFNFVNGVIPKSIAASLAKAGLELDAIDWFALHQGSGYMIAALAKRVGIPESKLRMNIDRYGNTVSSTVPMLLEELIEKGEAAGRTILVSGFGVGLSWATGILKFPSTDTN